MSYIDIQAEHNRRERLYLDSKRELEQLKREYISKYVDNENAVISCNYLCRIDIHDRTYYVGGIGSDVSNLKPEGCNMSIPTTEAEIRKRVAVNKECQKAAVRAYLAYKYITGGSND